MKKSIKYKFNQALSSGPMIVNNIVIDGKVVGLRYITEDDDWVEINGVKTPFSEWI